MVWFKKKHRIEPAFKIGEFKVLLPNNNRSEPFGYMLKQRIHRKYVLIDCFLKCDENIYLAYMCFAYLQANLLYLTSYHAIAAISVLQQVFLTKNSVLEINFTKAGRTAVKKIKEFCTNSSNKELERKEFDELTGAVEQTLTSLETELSTTLFSMPPPIYKAYSKKGPEKLRQGVENPMKKFKYSEFIMENRKYPKEYLKKVEKANKALQDVGFPMDAIWCGVDKT